MKTTYVNFTGAPNSASIPAPGCLGVQSGFLMTSGDSPRYLLQSSGSLAGIFSNRDLNGFLGVSWTRVLKVGSAQDSAWSKFWELFSLIEFL